MSRLWLGIEIVIRIAVENRGLVLDPRIARRLDWLDRHVALQRLLHFPGIKEISVSVYDVYTMSFTMGEVVV
jgi:hypothetical protein